MAKLAARAAQVAALAQHSASSPSRICTRCHVSLPATLVFFPPNQRGLYGLSSRCRPCGSQDTMDWRKRGDPTFARTRAWNKNNAAAHAEHSRRDRRRWTPAHYEHRRRQCKAYQERRSLDGRWRLMRAMRSQIVLILRNRMPGDGKRGLLRRLGYTRAALIAHLEAQLQPGMTWANYGRGGWEVDHHIPVSSFDLTDPDQFRACWALTNLRPLWVTENRMKAARMPV